MGGSSTVHLRSGGFGLGLRDPYQNGWTISFQRRREVGLDDDDVGRGSVGREVPGAQADKIRM